MLLENTVDFISFPYYNSEFVSLDSGNSESSFDTLYVAGNEKYEAQMDPLGLRISLNEIYDRYQKPLFIGESTVGGKDELVNDR